MNVYHYLQSKKMLGVAVIALTVLFYFLIPFAIPLPAKRALCIFIIAGIFWALEIIPLYATSITLVVCLTLFIASSGNYTTYFSQFAHPIIFLFFGGLVLAKALSKHQLDQIIAQKCASFIGDSPFLLLTGYLLITAFLSMWISNTAAAAIILSLISPILAQAPKEDPLQKALPLAIAFGASIGGIATPIGTPPNALAIGILAEHGIKISFLQWVSMTLPLALIILFVSIMVIWFFFPPKSKILMPKLQPITLNKNGIKVLLGAVGMIALWLTSPFHKLPESLVALMGVSYFVAFELLELKDIKSIEWDVLFLMWGGLALGEAMITSKLIPNLFENIHQMSGNFWLFVVFCILSMILSSFMSNTATASLLLPIIVYFPLENKILLSIVIALCCSLTLTFPISTPPNALAYAMRTFSTKDMFKSGFIISVFALIIIILGFDLVIPNFIPFN